MRPTLFSRLTLLGLLSLLPSSGACRASSSAPSRAVDPTVAANATTSPAGDTNPKENTPMVHPLYAKPSEADLRQKLTPLQFQVTQRDATEPPFHNDFWDNHEAGLYVDVATGEPLFSSLDKFESGTGWPSFTRPVEDGHVVSKSDSTYGMIRTEVRSTAGNSHLGHVFDDGPAPSGLRYCINSAALRFIPVSQLAAQGYGAYLSRFQGAPGAQPVPASTTNSCTVPAPGERAGCETTLETALIAGDEATAAALRHVEGVLEGTVGRLGKPGEPDSSTVRVVFDPKQTTYRDLLDKWAREGASSSPIYCSSEEQCRTAEAWNADRPKVERRTIRTADLSAFVDPPVRAH